MIKMIRLRTELHWGYSVKVPETGKTQAALYLPPPTSLVGALVMPIARTQGLGEVLLDSGSPSSATQRFLPMFRGAACHLDRAGIYWQDINRHVILLLQRRGERRADPKYRYGAIATGKLFAPSAVLDIAYLVDTAQAEKLLGREWERVLYSALSQVMWVGNKESLVSPCEATISDAKPVTGEVTTTFYFPADSAKVLEGNVFSTSFWSGGFIFGERGTLVPYLIPGHRTPFECHRVLVRVLGEGFTDGEDTVILQCSK